MYLPNAPRSRHATQTVRRLIHEHRKRTSSIYADVAMWSAEQRAAFLSDLRNPLERKYVAQRIEEAVADIALKRMVNNELDPFPYEHAHEGCAMHGLRTNVKDEHDVFNPREGFVTNESAYTA